MAVDQSGYVITSLNPTAESPTWTSQLVNHSGTIAGVSCAPETTTCVAIADSDPNVFTTTTPDGSWNSAVVDAGKEAVSVSCGSATLCAIGSSGYGSVLLTNDPASSSPTWSSEVQVSPHIVRVEVACASTFCVATDDDGDVVTSNENPTIASSTWSLARPDGWNVLTSVSCPTSSLCAAGDNAGDLLTTNNPTAASASWSIQTVDPGNTIRAVSCDPSATVCVAVDNSGRELSSGNPTAAAPTWSPPVDIDGYHALSAVSCPSAGLCIAVDGFNNVLTTTDPGAATPTWATYQVMNGYPFVSLSCPSVHFCMIGWQVAGRWGEISSTTPTDPSSWVGGSGPGLPAYLTSASCASSTFCAASVSEPEPSQEPPAQSGAFATDLTSPQSRWAFTAAPVGIINCPTTAFCVAANGPAEGIGPTATAAGSALLAGASGAWTDQWVWPTGSTGIHVAPDPNAALEAISCASSNLCLAVDGVGYAMNGRAGATLSLAIAGTGRGQVTGTTLSCTMTCSQNYQTDSTITLVPTAAPGSMFTGWSDGPCSGTGRCDIAMSGDRHVTATFLREERLRVAVLGRGRVTGAGLGCPGTCESADAAGTIALTATPAPGYRFAGWSGADCRETATCTFTIVRPTDVTAKFVLAPPACRLQVANDHVLIHRKGHQVFGAIETSATCNRPGRMVLTGTTIERLPGHKRRFRTAPTATVRLTIHRGGTFLTWLRHSRSALLGLSHRAHESARLALVERTTDGVARASATTRSLQPR